MATRALQPSAVAAPTRLVSLDVFRGLTMAAMVIVNNPGDWSNVYAPLLHAEWNGWTPTDLIFPFFLFIVGVSITLSRRSASWGSIVRRALIIFALGLFLAGFPRFNVSTWRIPGVLQRIAVCYFVAAGTYKALRSRRGPELGTRGPGLGTRERLRPERGGGAQSGEAGPPSESAWGWGPTRIKKRGSGRLSGKGAKERAAPFLALVAIVLILIYWAILMLVPPPGGVAGDLSPEGNLGAHIDRALMAGHLWRPRWDPEGLLSTIPAIATTMFGILVGLWLGSTAPSGRKASGMAIGGAVALAAGLAWDPFFAINKNLWTSSYVLFTAGFASLLLAIIYWIIDVQGWRRWTQPFVILGANAITLYVLSGLLAKTLGVVKVTDAAGREVGLGHYLFVEIFAPLASPKNASLLYALANLVALFAVLAWMYRRRLFLRV
jgi:predicted acyltransferase